MLNYGVKIYSCKDVADKYEGVKCLKPNKKYKIGKFIVQPIPVQHSVENYGYLIEHPKMGRLVFITDLCDFPYKIPNVNHWIIEANYDEQIVFDRLCNNEINRSKSKTHLSINQCVQILKNNLCDDTRNIMLIHLSHENSDEKMFIQKVKDATNITPVVAKPKVIMELNKELF